MTPMVVNKKRIFAKKIALLTLGLWGLFILLIAVMIALGNLMPRAAEDVTLAFSESLESSGFFEEDGSFSLITLTLGNTRAAFICACLGAIPFLMLPVLVLGINALVSGFVLSFTAASSGIELWRLIAFGILPHGIFEITALVLASAIGINICIELCRIICGGRGPVPFGRVLLYSGVSFAAIVVPLMALAGIVETYVTPLLLGMAY